MRPATVTRLARLSGGTEAERLRARSRHGETQKPQQATARRELEGLTGSLGSLSALLVRPQMRGRRGARTRPRVVASAHPATGARCARARRRVRRPHARPLRSHQRGQRGHQESRQKGCVMNTPRREAESRHTNTTPRREVADGRAPVGGGRESTHLHRAASRGGRWTSAHAARRGRESTHTTPRREEA